MTAPQFIVVRIKDCPIRGEVHVIESLPGSLVDAHRWMVAMQADRPGDVFVCEMLTDADLLEFA